MDTNAIGKHPSFYAIGLSYKKADAETRQEFPHLLLGNIISALGFSGHYSAA